MSLEYGNQEVIRFMFDKTDKKLILTVKQEILEDGVLKDHIFPNIVARQEDFDTTMERLLPSDTTQMQDADIKKHIEIEGKAALQEKWEQEKHKRINQEKTK